MRMHVLVFSVRMDYILLNAVHECRKLCVIADVGVSSRRSSAV